MKTGIELIAEERLRQVEKEGWSFEHDDKHHNQELARAAAAYATPELFRDYSEYHEAPVGWPQSWSEDWWKPSPDDRIKELAKAGALIAAEIDRIQRLKT